MVESESLSVLTAPVDLLAPGGSSAVASVASVVSVVSVVFEVVWVDRGSPSVVSVSIAFWVADVLSVFSLFVCVSLVCSLVLSFPFGGIGVFLPSGGTVSVSVVLVVLGVVWVDRGSPSVVSVLSLMVVISVSIAFGVSDASAGSVLLVCSLFVCVLLMFAVFSPLGGTVSRLGNSVSSRVGSSWVGWMGFHAVDEVCRSFSQSVEV